MTITDQTQVQKRKINRKLRDFRRSLKPGSLVSDPQFDYGSLIILDFDEIEKKVRNKTSLYVDSKYKSLNPKLDKKTIIFLEEKSILVEEYTLKNNILVIDHVKNIKTVCLHRFYKILYGNVIGYIDADTFEKKCNPPDYNNFNITTGNTINVNWPPYTNINISAPITTYPTYISTGTTTATITIPPSTAITSGHVISGILKNYKS